MRIPYSINIMGILGHGRSIIPRTRTNKNVEPQRKVPENIPKIVDTISVNDKALLVPNHEKLTEKPGLLSRIASWMSSVAGGVAKFFAGIFKKEQRQILQKFSPQRVRPETKAELKELAKEKATEATQTQISNPAEHLATYGVLPGTDKKIIPDFVKKADANKAKDAPISGSLK